MKGLVLRGHPGFGQTVEGEALVSREAFSARYDLDRATGVISRRGHSIEGHRIVDKIVIFPTAKGGVAAGWAFHDMRTRGVAPRGLIFGRANPVVVQGAVFAGIPILDQLAPDPLEVIQTGDWVRLDPAAGTVTILARREANHEREG